MQKQRTNDFSAILDVTVVMKSWASDGVSLVSSARFKGQGQRRRSGRWESQALAFEEEPRSRP